MQPGEVLVRAEYLSVEGVRRVNERFCAESSVQLRGFLAIEAQVKLLPLHAFAPI